MAKTKYLGESSLNRFLEKLIEKFSRIGHTHAKNDIVDFPSIPSKVSELQNDSGYVKNTDSASSSLGLVKSGGDVTISNGTITVNDDSHNHVTANIDGLQAKLDEIDGDISGINTDIENISSDIDTINAALQPMTNDEIDSICK